MMAELALVFAERLIDIHDRNISVNIKDAINLQSETIAQAQCAIDANREITVQ
jgi:hypothetical protein